MFSLTDPGQAFVRPSSTNNPEQYALGKSKELTVLILLTTFPVCNVCGCAFDMCKEVHGKYVQTHATVF
jgi:hypothetical protein